MTESHGQPRGAAKVLPLRRASPAVNTEGREHYLAHIDARLARLGNDAALADRALRTAARADFARLAFPTSKQELWKYTPLAPLARVDHAPSRAVDDSKLDAQTLKQRFAITLPSSGPLAVLLNGRLSAKLSRLDGLPSGVAVVQSLADAVRAGAAALFGTVAQSSEHPFVALNTALWTDGLFVKLAKGARLEQPLQVVHLALPSGAETVAELSAGATPAAHAQASYARVLVVAEERSSATLVESYVSGGVEKAGAPSHFTSAVTELWLGANAYVTRVGVLREPGLHLGITEVRQSASSRFVSSVFSLGGSLSRSEVNVHLAEPGAECVLDGLYLGEGHELHDHQTFIEHAVPQCTSAELYKGVLAGNANAVFHGRIRVLPDAQKTVSAQTNKTLLLSPSAVINTKPGLEIFADDVKATHGAAIGQLDPLQLFYLRARGIGVTEAKQMLTYAFAKEVVDRVEDVALRAELDGHVQERLRSLSTPEGSAS